MNEYKIQRYKDLTYAQQRNKQQKKQLANYKEVHEKDLKEIERLKEENERLRNALNEVIEINSKAIEYIEENMSEPNEGHLHLDFQGNVLDIYLILKGVDKNG